MWVLARADCDDYTVINNNNANNGAKNNDGGDVDDNGHDSGYGDDDGDSGYGDDDNSGDKNTISNAPNIINCLNIWFISACIFINLILN